MKGLDIPSRPLTFQRNQAAGSRPSGTIIRSGAGFSTTTVSTTRADGGTSLCAGFFTVARLGLALATVRFVAFALADLDALRALPRLADLRSFARFCTFDRFLGLAMIAIPLVGVRYRLPRRHGRSNDKRKSEQLIQRVFKSPLELNRARPARATCPPLAGSLLPRSPACPHSLGAALARNHPNSIRRCFKHGCAGRTLHSGRTEGGPLQHYRSDTHRCCMSRHLWGQRKAVGLIHDRRLCCLHNRGPGSPLIMLMLEAGDAQSA